MIKEPKIELHCHLDGSLRPETVLELAIANNIELPSKNLEALKESLQVPENCPSLEVYLKRFDLPIAVLQWADTIERATFELMEDASKENVKYIEIRFAPLFHIEKGLTVEEVIESAIRGIKKAETLYDIKGNLILSFLRFMSPQSIFETLDRCKQFLNKGVVAVDLAGNEEEGFADNFIEAMKYAKSLGFHITIHAGETGYGTNVVDAIEKLGAERIGHGVSILNHKASYELVKEKKIALEMCPTSNVDTSIVKTFKNHPIIDFYRNDLSVTFNTDNRTVSNTSMTKEIEQSVECFDLTNAEYQDIYKQTVVATFASDDIKKWLLTFI